MVRIRIGVSACLLGKNVRYDGGNKRDDFIVDNLAQEFELVPVCPETEMGLGVPRESMRLEGDPDSPHLVTITTRIDLTDRMHSWSAERINKLESQPLHGFIFKSKSPSCAMGTGLFARALAQRFPGLPVIDEVRLRDAGLRKHFIELLQSGGAAG